uniref:Cdc42-interacting protein 4 homolog n=1 Tax=Phallusia mammillata TaxID=59560 RepID=A0A6F9DVT8_9ASCI|nr:cdc42-interacting protein 4 homolog [Phallusia mammillata]
MYWRVELWDKFENVDKQLQHNIDFGEKYAKFVKERCSIEMEYATKMRKLVKSFQPKKREEDRSMFSTHKAFQSQLSELNDIAGQHETVAEEMMSKVSKSAQAYYNEIKVEKKKLYQDGRHHQSTLDQHERTLDQIKKKFEKEWKECERSESYFQKLDADTNVTKADVEKAKHMWMSRKDTVESCKTDYGAYLQQFNTEQTDHYQTVMPKIFACYRDCDEKGIIKFKDLMVEYAKIEQNVKPIIQKCLDGMARAANAIDAKLDAALVVERLKSGFVPPNDKEFEDFTSPNHGKTNHEDGSDSQRNSLVIGKQPNRKGLSWLFGQKKPAAVNYIRKQFSAESSPFTRSSSVTSDERKFEPEDSSNTPSQNEPKSETVQKSRTLSLTKKKQDYVNVDVDSDETLTRENRSSSYDVLREKNNSLSKQNGRQRSGSGDIRSSVSKNKKKLKTMFRMSTKPPEFAPKIEVSAPISVDMSGSAISTEGFIAAGVDTKPKSNFENLYDEVAGGDAEGVSRSSAPFPLDENLEMRFCTDWADFISACSYHRWFPFISV